MKARLPQGYGGGGGQNLQQLARQAQKMQDQMEAATEELNAKEYTASSGGGMVKVTISGEMEMNVPRSSQMAHAWLKAALISISPST